MTVADAMSYVTGRIENCKAKAAKLQQAERIAKSANYMNMSRLATPPDMSGATAIAKSGPSLKAIVESRLDGGDYMGGIEATNLRLLTGPFGQVSAASMEPWRESKFCDKSWPFDLTRVRSLLSGRSSDTAAVAMVLKTSRRLHHPTKDTGVVPSYDWNPSDPPSAQLKAMASIWRGNEPLNIGEMEWALRMSFASACRRIDSEFCEPEILKTLALHLRCQPRYLHAIHNARRRDGFT